MVERTSSQDGGIGKHTLPPPATMGRIVTDFKTNNTQNHHKIELYGILTSKDLKRTH